MGTAWEPRCVVLDKFFNIFVHACQIIFTRAQTTLTQVQAWIGLSVAMLLVGKNGTTVDSLQLCPRKSLLVA